MKNLRFQFAGGVGGFVRPFFFGFEGVNGGFWSVSGVWGWVGMGLFVGEAGSSQRAVGRGSASGGTGGTAGESGGKPPHSRRGDCDRRHRLLLYLYRGRCAFGHQNAQRDFSKTRFLGNNAEKNFIFWDFSDFGRCAFGRAGREIGRLTEDGVFQPRIHKPMS
jgi:hypothetical protein